MGRTLTFFLVAWVSLNLAPAHAQERRGFTGLLSLGYGMQNGGVRQGTQDAIAASIGIGGFVLKDTALMLRVSGTAVSTREGSGLFGRYNRAVISGVAVLAGQWWLDERFDIEFGVGFGFLSFFSDFRPGLGLLLGSGYSLLSKDKFDVQIGIEWAPAFYDDFEVSNVGIVARIQFLQR